MSDQPSESSGTASTDPSKKMASHRATVVVNAPVHQVYEMFTRFTDYPKFMHHVKEVTDLGGERTHWVVDIIGRHEWDAVNQGWLQDRQVGWRSTEGLENFGFVQFESVSERQTRIDVTINYNPPVGALGDAGEALGAGKRFEKALQDDLDRFARVVESAAPDTLDPQSATYVFRTRDSRSSSDQSSTSSTASDESLEQTDGERPQGPPVKRAADTISS